MKKFFAISLILIAFVECTLTEALLSSDIARFKSIAHRVNEFVDIGDKYYAVQLGAELKEKVEKVDCEKLEVKRSTVEEELYYYNVRKSGNCKASVPKSIGTVLEKVESLVDVNFALQFPKVKADNAKIITSVFNRLNACSSLSCSTLSFNEKVAAISIISRLFDSVPVATKNEVKNYQTIAQNLLNALVAEKFVSSDSSFKTITELTLFAAAHNLLNEKVVADVTAYFMQLHATTRPEIAFALLRASRILAPLAAPHVCSIQASYSAEGEVVLRITDILDHPTADLSVSLRKGSDESVGAQFVKDTYIAKMKLEVGEHQLAVKVHTAERSNTYSISVVVPVAMSIPSFTTTLKGNTAKYTLPEEQASLTLEPKEFLTINVNSQIPVDFVPATTILQLVEKNSKKSVSVPMRRSEKGFMVELTPSRADLGMLVNYEDSIFSLVFLCGDKLLPKSMQIPLGEVEIHFGGKPKEVIYPLYSKPLMYATEQSLAPMKEIEHVFQPEHANPFFIFPLGFAMMVVVVLLGLVAMWCRIGVQMKKEDMTKKIAKGVFVGCIAVIVALYANFWFRGNMASLLKQLVPVVAITLIAGNRAL